MTGYALLASQLLLLAVFAVAVAGKLTRGGFGEFVAATGRLLPARLSGRRRPVAAVVLAAELATAGLLIWPASAPVGFGLALGLGVAFSAGIIAAVRRGERGPCRCFGASTAPLGKGHLVRNGILIAVAVGGLVLAWLPQSAPVTPVGLGLSALAAMVLAALVVRLDDLLALFAPMPT